MTRTLLFLFSPLRPYRRRTLGVYSFLNYIRALPGYKKQIVHVERLASRQAATERLEEPLHPALQDSLRQIGVEELYTHQAQAVRAVREGHNVVVATSTASGKTLCYNIPVLETLIKKPRARALYLFPTKALAQDQLRSLGELTTANFPELKYATFDGDTPQHARTQIKRSAQIVLTNPDMLHLGILPNHASWSALFRNLSYVVIDEAHVYRGVFGSHVGNVLRRLRRICRMYHSEPQFICCSATIANPKEHLERLLGDTVDVVDQDGSPHGSKDFAFWNPPILDPVGSTRRSPNSEAAFLFTEMVRQGIRNITFAKTRRVTELIYLWAREELAEREPDLAARISPYRAGYLAQDRRAIERGLFEGDLLGVTATTALELGVDIGDLEATILTGYPGSIASTWQQAGRSGRGEAHSVSVLIGLDNPLDQYIMRHPEHFFGKTHEHALIDPGNRYILPEHLRCAAYELPLTRADQSLFGEGFDDSVAALEAEGSLRKQGASWFISPSVLYPAQDVNIRSTSGGSYTIVDASQGNRVLETVEPSTAFLQAHPGAVYLHQGETFLIKELDLNTKTAYAVSTEVPYYTQSRDVTETEILSFDRRKKVGEAEVCYGRVRVTSQVIAYKKKRQFSEEILGEEPLDLPPSSFETMALWFDAPREIDRRVSDADLHFRGGLHAIEHAAIGMLPFFAMCDRQDIGGYSTEYHVATAKPQIFIYDAHHGGIGISEKGYELIVELWQRTLDLITECPCKDGCPSCIQSPKCGNNNVPLDKEAARMTLDLLLKQAKDPTILARTEG